MNVNGSSFHVMLTHNFLHFMVKMTADYEQGLFPLHTRKYYSPTPLVLNIKVIM